MLIVVITKLIAHAGIDDLIKKLKEALLELPILNDIGLKQYLNPPICRSKCADRVRSCRRSRVCCL